MATIYDSIRTGQIIADGNQNVPGTVFYRGIFVKGNFLLYRRVWPGCNYRGCKWQDGYAFAWSDMQGENISLPPAFVPLEGDDE